ncbi:RNA-guided endonuclease InsQ/TnpB family protein [Ktedonobacter racemifer]|uniref:Transposase, IS605 OrfB family n=1 Tax=Ktedonobacter racemifer DSM 44963 TaxID=485913 RepID=D6TWR6_KTERA|nr:RNA-guided endonuclease TnpB family protein [Ktedonobacter racemifer]EFH84649.1 transposase, IS605 OrfB family [Ktedonobacter racemifer DSM 44963]
MQLVERHIICKGDSRYAAIDAASFASKNLYNLANYHMRQSFIHTGKYLSSVDVYHLVKDTDAYKALPRKVSNDVLRLLEKNWKAFRKGLAAWFEDPSKFEGRPKVPKYKDKQKGRNILIYDIQAISKKALKKQGMIAPSLLGIEIPTKQAHVKQARIIPRSGFYVVEVVYEQEPKQAAVDPLLVAGIDIGLNNVATLTSNKAGFTPWLVNGRPLKHINQWYNKERARLQSHLSKHKRHTSTRLERLTNKRTRKIDHYLHTHSHRLIEHLIEEGIGTLVIGKNDGWKQEINIGNRNNQQFVQIPFARFIDMLRYKAELVGIHVILQEESYTYWCSFLDLEPLCHHEHYLGKRIKRGLFRTSTGRRINADVNGSLNILRKAIPESFGQGIVGVAVRPVGAPTY